MQVKKFEAQNMKEALEMIKAQLGPEAIILSVRDYSASFGLMGKKSIEVTAAISEKQVEKRRWAESRLNNEEIERLRRSSAKTQKQFIEKSVNRYIKPPLVYDEQAPRSRKELTKVPYIDIQDDLKKHSTKIGSRVDDLLNQLEVKVNFTESTQESSSRVKLAAKKALEAFEGVVEKPEPPKNLDTLRSEVSNLKRLINEMKMNGPAAVQAPVVAAPLFQDVLNKLVYSGISEANSKDLIQKAMIDLRPEYHRSAQIEANIVKQMLSDIRIVDHAMPSPLQIFIGPRGHGKTSTLVKLAADAVIKDNKKVAIFSADQNKVAAVDQLKIYAQILNVPFGLIKSAQDWDLVAANLINFDYIFVDFPGSSLRDIEEISDIRRLLPPVHLKKDIHLVLSVATKDHDAFEFAERYRFCAYKDVIFTFLDESLNHGVIYNFQKKFEVPLHSFGVGSKLPEDLELASRERVIDLIFKFTKIRTGSYNEPISG